MKRTKKISRGNTIAILVAALMFVTACASFGTVASATPTATTGPLPTDVAATTQAPIPTNTTTPIPPTDTAVPPPPTLLPPTQVPAPPGAIRINFLTGATASNTPGTISPGQVQNYLVHALDGQPMIAMVDSPNHDLTMAIYGLQTETVLLPASAKRNSWQGTLPAIDDYVVQVIGGTTNQNFNLSLTIASRISFSPEAISATTSGSTQDGYNITYALYALAGQTMKVDLTPISGKAALEVWGFSDGQPYLRSVVESTTFNVKLPATQDYIIAVVPFAGQVVDFNLTVEVK
jgi:hypothetical protein